MSLKNKNLRLFSYLFNKYTVVVAAFLVFLIFFDDHNLIKKNKMKNEIEQLETELKDYRYKLADNREEIKRLRTDTAYLEKVAREKYYMKNENEDIFLFNEAK